MAVAIEDGLVVPVLKNVNALSFSQVSNGIRLGTKGKQGLKANEMGGSTFSISNFKNV